MESLKAAWQSASTNQRVTILAAVLVTLGAVAFTSTGSPQQSGIAAIATRTLHSPITTQLAVASPAPSSPAAVTPSENPTAAASSPAPGPTNSHTPAPTPRPNPTPKPSKSPSLTLKFTALSSPVNPGGYATATVLTSPGAYCTIVVEYKSGPSTASGLAPTNANSSGIASWTWKVGTRTTAGSWPVTVSCSKAGLERSITKYFSVS